MSDAKAIVSTVTKIDQPIDAVGLSTVHFEDGQVGMLNTSDPRGAAYAGILDELRGIGDPVYVEVDPTSKLISRLLIPLVVTVTDLFTLPTGDVEVEVEPSQARHILRMTDSNAERLRKTLVQAKAEGLLVVLTETSEDHRIIDIRPVSNPKTPATDFMSPASIESVSFELRTVTRRRACELFALVASKSCDPIAADSPCIPFLYPDDGCWARAHEMCRLILRAGESVMKYWIYGNLEVKTANHPHCKVAWSWHVAPILLVQKRTMSGIQVIDPSMFRQPVSGSTWQSAQNRAKAIIVLTDASVFLRFKTGRQKHDPTYCETQKALAIYRLRLKLRSIHHLGPPPYNCP